MATRELTGVKVKPGLGRAALNLLLRRGWLDAGRVTYSVVACGAPPPCPPPKPRPPEKKPQKEKRTGLRRRTRLRSGKLLDGANRFVIDVAILDRSADGLRLRLAIDEAIPPKFRLFDDETELAFPAQIVWRQGELIGVRLTSAAPLRLTPRQILALRKYYAIRD